MASTLTSNQGCSSPYSDDFLISAVGTINNQGDGIFCRGGDCNAGTVRDTFLYYNGLWGGEDQGFLGNTWEANQASYNGISEATATIPPTTPVDAISRNSGTVTVTLKQPPSPAIVVGHAVVIVGVGDSSFNSPPGGAYFITSVATNSLTYIQPGAPLDAASTGGTVRIATFREAYLAAGVDNGSYKIGTASQVQSFASINNYQEGGQRCKYGTSGLTFGGTGNPLCAATPTWRGNFIENGAPTFSSEGMGSNLGVFQNLRDVGYQMFWQAGLNTDQQVFWSIFDHNGETVDGNVAWNWAYSPTAGVAGGGTAYGKNGISGTMELYRGAYGSARRMLFAGPSAGGYAQINSEDTAQGPRAVEINADGAAGTGGLAIFSGASTGKGGSPPPQTEVASIDGNGRGSFSGGVQATSFRTGQAANSDAAGRIVLAASGSASRPFTGRYTQAPICVASDITAVNPVRVELNAAAPFTLTLTGTGNDTVNYICLGLE